MFESLYSNLDLKSGKTYKKEQNIEKRNLKNISDIIGNLVNLDAKIEPSIVLEIKELLLSSIRGSTQ